MISSLRRLSPAVIATFALILASCSPEPTRSPSQLDRTELLDTVIETGEELVNGLVYCPSTQSFAGSARIGRSGGTLTVGPHALVVPPNSLTEDVTITAQAPAGDYVLVTFEPAGLTFKRSAALTMSYAHCGLTSSLLPKKIVYLEKNTTNILEVLLSVDDVLKQAVTGKLDHFSTYAVAD